MIGLARKCSRSCWVMVGVGCALTLLAIAPAPAMAAGGSGFAGRAYGRLGYLLLSPSEEDIGHLPLGGESAPFGSTNRFDIGGGAQFLLPPGPAGAGGFRLGADIGAGTLWSDELDYWYEGDASGEVYRDHELALYLLGIAEYSPPRSPWVVQGGAGVYGVFWSWTRDYAGGSNEDSGVATHAGAMGALGYRAPFLPKGAAPIMLRLDYIGRHGGLMSASVTAGIEFTP
jgi:hypothetical protein